MAKDANTFATFDNVGIREDLLDAIFRISPEDTPFMTTIGRGKKAEATLVEWQTDALRAAADNAQLEGDEFSKKASTPPVRVKNHCQIMNEQLTVSATNEAVTKAGRRSEIAYQKEKKAAALKLDMERAMIGVNQASVARAGATVGRLGSMQSWLTTNVSRGAAGANGGYNTGTGLTVAATDGTTRAFTETLLKTVMQQCFTNGAKPKTAFMGPANKVLFSAFAGIAVNRVDNEPMKGSEKQLAILGAADVYKSDFGNITAVASRHVRTRDCLLIDPEYANVRFLRGFNWQKLAKTGDYDSYATVVEFSMQVSNESAHGIIADLS